MTTQLKQPIDQYAQPQLTLPMATFQNRCPYVPKFYCNPTLATECYNRTEAARKNLPPKER